MCKCTMGVGCNKHKACYAEYHGRPELCPIARGHRIHGRLERYFIRHDALKRAQEAIARLNLDKANSRG